MSHLADRILVQEHLAHEKLPQEKSPEEQIRLIADIKSLLKSKNASIVAHYYTDPVIQALAEETGGCVADSLEMARFGSKAEASTLLVAGVKFMGETAKILSPEKRVIMPTLEATCSLDIGCPIDEFSAFCDQHSDRTVVVYANTSAEVKARADWVVTSSIALDVVEYLDRKGEKILWAPDKHLGGYIQKQTGADMLMWDGSCIVHEEFKSQGVQDLKKIYPDAALLVHPESPDSMVELADAVGSTSQLIKASQTLPNSQFIVATDNGIFYKMKQKSPDKLFIEAPTAGNGATCRSCAHCPWMAMNALDNIYESLLKLDDSQADMSLNEVFVGADLRERALIPLNRMLNFGS